MKSVKIVGFDPSLRNWGYCIAYYDQAKDILSIQTGGVIHSYADKTLRKNLSDYQAATTLYKSLHKLIADHQPDLIIAELPIGSQSSRAMVSYGICIGLSAAVAYTPDKHHPLQVITPQSIKKTVGQKDATKQQVIDWVMDNYPDTQSWLASIPKGKQEHICDAIAAVHTYIKGKSYENRTKSC